jgi:hypothetical protein
MTGRGEFLEGGWIFTNVPAQMDAGAWGQKCSACGNGPRTPSKFRDKDVLLSIDKNPRPTLGQEDPRPNTLFNVMNLA